MSTMRDLMDSEFFFAFRSIFIPSVVFLCPCLVWSPATSIKNEVSCHKRLMLLAENFLKQFVPAPGTRP